VISPLLANVYLHYVFDLWAERWRRRDAIAESLLVRLGGKHQLPKKPITPKYKLSAFLIISSRQRFHMRGSISEIAGQAYERVIKTPNIRQPG